MKHIFFCTLCILTLTGCPDSGGKSGGGTSGDSGGEMTDGRWKQKMLQNTLTSLQQLSDTRNPDDCRQSARQAVEQLHAWIKEEKAPAGWRVDPLAEKWVTIFDDLQEVVEPLDAVIRALKFPETYTLEGDDLVGVFGKMVRASDKITPDFPPVMQDLKRFLNGQSQYIAAVLAKDMKLSQAEAQEFAQMMVMTDLALKRLAALGGSARMAFSIGENLEELDFNHPLRNAMLGDVGILFELFLLRDVSAWAQGAPTAQTQAADIKKEAVTDVSGVRNEVKIAADDLSRAAAIFDWCVMNIALEENRVPADFGNLGAAATPRLPREVLLAGRGTALERAWVFILLARQQNLNAVMLRVPLAEGSRHLVAYVRPEHGIYLFDPELGMAVPGVSGAPEGEKSEKIATGMLKIVPLTWEKLAAGGETVTALEKFWQDAGLTLTLAPDFAEKTVALVEASAPYLSLRMRVLQPQLTGYSRAVLVAEPTVAADYLRGTGLFDGRVQLWAYPYETVVYRALNLRLTEEGMFFQTTEDELHLAVPFLRAGGEPLWRGRMLHLKGVLTGRLSATSYYQRARLSEADMNAMALRGMPLDEDAKAILREMRVMVSFFMGNISLAVGNAASAEEYFRVHVLDMAQPENPWLSPAYYALGRVAELEADPEKAASRYEKITDNNQGKARVTAINNERNPHE